MKDVKVIKLSQRGSKNLETSQLVLEFSSKKISLPLINMLRRVSLLFIPTYAFTKDSINIEENTSVFNNDMMKLRLSQFTYPNIKNNIVDFEDKYWKNVDYSDPEREVHPDDKLDVKMYIDIKNDTNDIMNVTTHDAEYYIDNESTNDVLKYDKCLLIKLKKGESFKCNAKLVLGIGLLDDIFAAAANCYYMEEDKNKCKFIIESQGQLSEKDILLKACDVSISRLNLIKNEMNEKYKDINDKSNATKLQVLFENQDHTFCNCINDFIQDDKNTVFSGFSKPDQLKRESVIKIVSLPNKPCINIIMSSIDEIITVINNIKKQVSKF